MTIHSYLQTAESVDPILVNATRDKKSGRTLTAPTQQMIKLFSATLPNQFELQHIVWEQAKAYNLKGPQIKALCDLVKDKDSTEARAALSETDIANIEPAYAETTGRRLRRAADPRHKGAVALRAARIEIERVNQRVQQSLDRREEVDPEMLKNLNETVREARVLQTQLGSLATKIAELKARLPTNESYETGIPINQQAVERDYVRHQAETAKNRGRKPQPRLRGGIPLAVELPTFGKFSNEDWGSLEPYHRLALTLDRDDLQKEVFDSPALLLRRALELSVLPEEIEVVNNPAEVSSYTQHLIKLLTTNAPRSIGPVITRDKVHNRITLTSTGKLYLSEVINNALLAVDDSRE